jgi:hypothetical protein
MHHCSESIFKVDYLREYESIYETALAHESVNPGVLFDEKTRGPKSRETVPLKVFIICFYNVCKILQKLTRTGLVSDFINVDFSER